jgi:hypothetical protein
MSAVPPALLDPIEALANFGQIALPAAAAGPARLPPRAHASLDPPGALGLPRAQEAP